jgi:hypothetical protein
MHENLSEFEKALKTLTPAAARVDSARVLFQAGQVSAARRTRRWQLATVVFALLTFMVGAAWALQPARAPQVRIVQLPAPPVEVPQPAPPEPAPPQHAIPEPAPAPSYSTQPTLHASYYMLQRQVLRWGVDALPGLPPAGREPPRTPQRGNAAPSRAALPRFSWFSFGDE